jgi:hypothetical protein
VVGGDVGLADRAQTLVAQVKPGERYGYLIVTEVLGALVRVRCDCGTRKTVRARHLRSGLIRSCGCAKAELCRIAKLPAVWRRIG